MLLLLFCLLLHRINNSRLDVVPVTIALAQSEFGLSKSIVTLKKVSRQRLS